MESLRPLRYFSSPSFVRTELSAGTLRSQGGTRLLGISEDFLRGFVMACEHETGPATVLILHRCGQFYGAGLARRSEAELSAHLGRSLRDCSMNEFQILVEDLWNGYGLGQLKTDWSCGQNGFLALKLSHSPMQDIGPKGHLSDDMFAGVIEGFFCHFAGEGLTCIQTGDLRMGDREGTTFVLVPAESAQRVHGLISARVPHSKIVQQLQGD